MRRSRNVDGGGNAKLMEGVTNSNVATMWVLPHARMTRRDDAKLPRAITPIVFTGLVETMGVVVALDARAEGARLSVATMLPGLELGESVSVSGACLTVAAVTVRGFEADLSHETLERTTLGALTEGARVNLERAVVAGDRLGGHLVSGHVDGKARASRIQPSG